MNSLFKEFKKTSKKDWLLKVEKDLKGKPLENLNWKINENLIVSPFANSQDLKESPVPLFEKRKTNSWEKGVWILVKNYKTANREALFLLEKGAEALCFEFQKNPNKKELQILLNGINHEWISTHFIFSQKSWYRIVRNFETILRDKKQDLSKIKFTIQFKNNREFTNDDISMFQDIIEQAPSLSFLTINSRNFYKGKETITSELAEIINHVNALLEKWAKRNNEIKHLLSKIQLSILLDDSYYLNIAKIRALKLLWQLLLKSWKISSNIPCNIEAHLTSKTHTKDENFNKIKMTTQAMSAIIGGVNRLYIYPTDAFKNKKGSQNQQRLSLNIQHLMQLESSMDRVIDPAAGSYFLEKLTDDIAESAWDIFKNMNA